MATIMPHDDHGDDAIMMMPLQIKDMNVSPAHDPPRPTPTCPCTATDAPGRLASNGGSCWSPPNTRCRCCWPLERHGSSPGAGGVTMTTIFSTFILICQPALFCHIILVIWAGLGNLEHLEHLERIMKSRAAGLRVARFRRRAETAHM